MTALETATSAPLPPASMASIAPTSVAADIGPHPPRARLALNVGVVGYGVENRQAPPTDGLRARIRTVLTTAREAAGAVARTHPEAFQATAPVLRLISTLETRLDRAAAQLALDLGFEVQAVLPCPRETLVGSLAGTGPEFLALLDRATAVFELDGAYNGTLAAHEAGEAAAEVLLDQSDLLIVLGDVNDPSSRTAWYVVAQARERELAMVALAEPEAESLAITISDRVGKPVQADLTTLRSHLETLLSPPAAGEDDKAEPDDKASATNADGTHRPLQDYFAETMPRRSWLAWTWTVFTGLVADNRLRRPRIRFDAFATSVTQWSRPWQATPQLPADLRQHIDQTLRTSYVWPDSMSLYYGGAYRGSFVISTLLGMATVLVVLLSFAVASGPDDDLSRLASVLFVLIILAATGLANRRRWHERWLDYRLLAELLRQQRFLAPMGRVPKFARLPAHDSYHDPRGTWMAWQAHAVARDAGLVTARVDAPYRSAYLAYLRDGLIMGIPPDIGQLDYHESAARRFERLELRAGDLKEGLMWAAIAVAIIEVADNRLWAGWNLPPWFSALVAVFAGLGGAITSVAGQADAGRVKKRSRAMRERLDHIRGSLERPEAATSAAALAELADAAADAMVAELADYRMVFQGKPLKYPG